MDILKMIDLIVDGYGDKWYICYPDGTIYCYPFKSYKSAKGAKIALAYLKRN